MSAPQASRPDFVVVGAPKAGTTSIHHYLDQHPDVFVPIKEPHYFCDDIDIRDSFDAETYFGLFDKRDGQRRAGDVSVWYLYSEEAADRILDELGPDTDIIAMLRNPVESAYSYHSQVVYNGDEQLTDFDEALDAEADRARGERIVEQSWKGPNTLQYTKIFRFADQLERYYDRFGRDRVHVIVFDDFKDDSKAAFNGLLDFLGVEPHPDVTFEKVNPNQGVRFAWLRDLYMQHDQKVRELGRLLIPDDDLRRTFGKKVFEVYKQLYTREEERKPMSEAARERLRRAYRDDVERLSELLDRDLTGWVEPQAATQRGAAE